MCASEYGADRVAQIITFGKLQARAAVRDVGRVLGLPFGQVNKVAELIPNNPGASGDAAAGDRRRAAAAGDARRGRRHRASAGDRVADRGAVSPRQHACRRRGDRRPAADRTGAAVSRSTLGLPGHAVFDEACRAGGAGEVRLPRPDHADHPEARREPAARPRHHHRCEPPAAGRPEDLRDAGEGRRRRRVPDGRPGRARHAAPDAPRPLRGPGRRGRAVSPRPDGQHPGLLPAQARGHIGGAAPEHPRHPGRDLRHHRLPGTGDADRPDDGGLLAGRRRSAAARDGQEDPRRDGGAARHLHQGRDRARHRSGEGHGSLRPDGEVRRLRLQQMPCRAVCAARLSDRVAEGEPSGGVHRRLHEPRARQHRPARGAARGGDALGHSHPAARHQPFRRRLHRRARRTTAAWRSATRWPR